MTIYDKAIPTPEEIFDRISEASYLELERLIIDELNNLSGFKVDENHKKYYAFSVSGTYSIELIDKLRKVMSEIGWKQIYASTNIDKSANIEQTEFKLYF